MHVYRYQYKNYNRSHDKRKKRRRILPVTILIVAAAVILSGGVRLDPGELGFLLQEEIVPPEEAEAEKASPLQKLLRKGGALNHAKPE